MLISENENRYQFGTLAALLESVRIERRRESELLKSISRSPQWETTYELLRDQLWRQTVTSLESDI